MSISVPNTFKGGTSIDSEEIDANFTALENALSDGTQNISVGVGGVVGSTVAGSVLCTGNCVVSGEAYGERSIIPLTVGHRALAAGTYWVAYYGDSGVPTSSAPTERCYIAGKSGSVVGYGVSYRVNWNSVVTGTYPGGALAIGKYASSTSTDFVALNAVDYGTAMVSTHGTLSKNTYSFSTGDAIYVRASVPTNASVELNVHIEVAWDS